VWPGTVSFSLLPAPRPELGRLLGVHGTNRSCEGRNLAPVVSGWWFQTWLDYFPFHIWDVILPIDFHIFQDGEIAPPTSQ
jgi:hypothetical protein